MDDEILYECGVDIDSSFTFQDGDLVLAKYEDNLVQAVANRLKTDLDELDLFYEDYGSVITGFLGWKQTDALHYIKAELDNVLMKEPRIYQHESQIEYLGNRKLRIELTLYTNNQDVVNANLILSTDGIIEVETDEEIEGEEE
jgi:hypothetical protein